MSGGGGGPSGTTTQIQKSDPWSGVQPYLTSGGNFTPTGVPGYNGPTQGLTAVPGLYQSAADLFASGGPQYYPGQTYAGETANQAAGLATAGNLGATATGAEGNILSSGFLNSNPGNAAYQGILSGNSPAIRAAVANVEPGIMDQFTGGQTVTPNSGAAYGVGQGVGNAIASQMLPAAQGLSENYSQAAGQQNTAAAFGAPSAAGIQVNAGGQQQALNQNVINDQIARYNYGQTQPYNLLDWYNGVLAGAPGGTSTLTTPYFTQRTGGFGGALSGAVSGAGLGSMFGPWGAGIGGIGGGLLGGFA